MKISKKEAEKFADSLSFKNGLVVAITQDGEGHVLMQAFMNREAVIKTLSTGKMHYWSRSRNRLWRKGEESGNEQAMQAFYPDCDRDVVLFEVKQKGVACHTGSDTCFKQPKRFTLSDVWRVIEDRARHPKQGSYTNRLLKDKKLAVAKLLEESKELAEAKKKKDVAWEAADVFYHALVLAAARGVSLSDIEKELERRRK